MKGRLQPHHALGARCNLTVIFDLIKRLHRSRLSQVNVLSVAFVFALNDRVGSVTF
jgi:hypothetical protein